MKAYEFQEYPQYVQLKGGRHSIVYSVEEHKNALISAGEDIEKITFSSRQEVPVMDAPQPVIDDAYGDLLDCDKPTENDKASLILRAESLGVFIDRRWSTSKISDAIAGRL